MRAATLRPSLTTSLWCPSRPARPATRRGAAGVVKAELDPTAALAVTQQAIAYGVFIAGEGLATRANLAEGTPGRPSLPATVGGAVAAVVSGVLVSGGGAGAGAGLALGAASSLALFAQYMKRALDVPGDRLAWPGPKAWPGSMALVSFLAVAVFAQALAGA